MIKRSLGLFLLVILLVSSCSRKKNTALSRAYHNTTSHFNGYFNAREILKEKETEMRERRKEDYSQILPIFIYPTEQESQSLYPDMDKVIDKCSEVIERHSIYQKKKEHTKWIDDSYFLIGKARLYKEEFGLAEKTFKYVYQAYKKTPDRYRGLNWLIKTLIETEQWDRAEEFLDLAEDEVSKYPEEALGHFYAIYADFHIKRDKDYDKAIEMLEQAVQHTKRKEIRRRYIYILAQLYHKKNNLLLATERYSRVLKLNPDYVMRFNARISRAIAYDVSSNNSSDIKKELNKMLRDTKNEEFRDQIYYALAELALKEDDEPLAIDYLRKSTKYSVSNDKQKGLSYLKLADIYFEQPHYINAQAHYDSTLQFLPDDHPEYFVAEEKNNNLQELVKNLLIIEEQDSLLALSKLGRKAIDKKIKKIIKDIKEKEEQQKLAELRKLEEKQEANDFNIGSFSRGPGRKGQWYFYNPTNMSLGLSDFKAQWGNRPLEDNWRRKSKRSRIIVQNNEETEGNENDGTKQDTTDQSEKYNPDFYLKNVPKDVNERLIAHGKIAEALFNVGTIFKESFTDYNNAITSFERITTQYDTSKHNLPAHYQLYRIYLINDYDEKAEEEKEWVLNNYPFSEYAYLIKNPNYNKETKETREKVEEFYAATYRLFKYKLYEDVIESCVKADQSFSENHIQAKFDFLKAKAIGHVRNREEFKLALEAIIKDHSEDKEVTKEAQFLLDYMNSITNKNESGTISKVQYSFNEGDKHMFILSSTTKNSKEFQALKNRLSNFNKQFFRQSNLTVTQSALDGSNLYLVRSFNNFKDAKRYLGALKNNTQLQVLIGKANAVEYLISVDNFRKLFKDKDEKKYINFFNREYPV